MGCWCLLTMSLPCCLSVAYTLLPSLFGPVSLGPRGPGERFSCEFVVLILCNSDYSNIAVFPIGVSGSPKPGEIWRCFGSKARGPQLQTTRAGIRFGVASVAGQSGVNSKKSCGEPFWCCFDSTASERERRCSGKAGWGPWGSGDIMDVAPGAP